MYRLLLEAFCPGNQQLVKCACNSATTTNWQDVIIVGIVSFSLIVIAYFIYWGFRQKKRIEVNSTSESEERKLALYEQEAKEKREAELLDRLLAFQKEHYMELSSQNETQYEITIKKELEFIRGNE